MQDVQVLRSHVTQIIYRLPLDSLTLLAEFASFLEAKLTAPFIKRTVDVETDASSVTDDDEFGLGTEISQLFSDIEDSELELPKRSMPRPAPNFME